MDKEMIKNIVETLLRAYEEGSYIPDSVLDWMNENGAGIDWLDA